MGLETGTYISDLVSSNPPGSDMRKQGDDHLRLIKAVLQATFPNATKPFQFPKILTKTANYTVLSGDVNTTFLVSSAAGIVTLTLPALVAGDAAWSIEIIKTDVALNALNITPTAGTINGEASLRMSNNYDAMTIIWTGTTWLAIVDKTARRVRAITADTTLTEADLESLILCTPVANTTITLPAVANYIGRALAICHITSGVFTTTIDGSGAETVNGAASVVMSTTRNTILLIATSTGWEIVGGSQSSYTVNAQTQQTPASGDFVGGYDISGAVEAKFLVSDLLAAASSAYTPGHIYGLGLSNAGGDTVNDITIAAGSVRSDDNTTNITLAAPITKQIDAIWAVGTNAGGMNTGAVANSTWYEVMIGIRPDTSVVDVWFTTTANRLTFPNVAYTKKRRIGWVRRGVATNLQFIQIDDYFTLITQVNDVSTVTTATAAAVTLTAPPDSIVRFRANLNGMTNNVTPLVSDKITTVFSEIVEGNVTPAASTGIASLIASMYSTASTGTGTEPSGHFDMRVSSTSTIEHDSVLTANTSATIDISTYGWIDNRGRLSDS